MSLVGWWRLEGNAENEVGQYDSYEVGGVSYSDGKLGQCYDNTAGNNTGIELLRHDDFTEYEDFYSFSLWFKSTTTSGSNNNRIISRDASEYPTITIDQDQASPQDMHFYEGTESNMPSVDANEWHHLVFTIDKGGNEAQIFIDGEFYASSGVNDDTTERPFVLGGNTEGDGDISGGHFEGKIDDVRLYDHVLSAKEVKQLSQAKVLHYKFNEDEDGTVSDASGQGNDGELNGPTFTEDSVIGSGSYYFDGDGDYISMDDVEMDSDSATTMGWFYIENFEPPNDRDNEVMFIHNEGNSTAQYLGFGDGDMHFETDVNNDGGGSISSSNITSQSWFHFALTFDDGTANMYIDSSYEGSVSLSDNNLTVNEIGHEMSGGSYQSGYPGWFDGRIDDVRFYNKTLSEDEIKEIYEQRASIDDTGNLHSHELSQLAETFPTNEFSQYWTIPNAYIKSDESVFGNYSVGSEGDGEIDAEWVPEYIEGGKQVDNFEYYWWETSSQTGHRVTLYDSNGDEVLYSETENPQWMLGHDGGETKIRDYDGQGYENWTKFRFNFDWDAGTFDILFIDETGDYVSTGTYDLKSSTDVAKVKLHGPTGSANHCRFDGFAFNTNQLTAAGIYGQTEFSEIGPAPDSLVGWWPLDGNTDDYSGNNNHGTNNGATISGGLGQSAYDFDGSNDSIVTELQFDKDDFTYSAWVNLNLVHRGNIICSLDNSSSEWARLQISNDNLQFTIDNNSTKQSATGSTPSTNTWLLVTGVRSGSDMTLYVDAEVDATNTHPESDTIEGLSNEVIGAQSKDPTNENWDGKIQDVRIYDRALTDAEVAQLYQLTDPRNDTRVSNSENGAVHTKQQFSEEL